MSGGSHFLAFLCALSFDLTMLMRDGVNAQALRTARADAVLLIDPDDIVLVYLHGIVFFWAFIITGVVGALLAGQDRMYH